MLAKLAVLAGMALPLYAQTADEQIAAHAKAAQTAERKNDFPAAVRNYEYLARVLPYNAEVQSNLGVALYFNHELTRAIDAFAKAIRMNPNLLTPHLFSGLAWYRLSNPDAAVPELEKAVRIQPSDIVAHTWLGYAYVDQLHYEAAAREFHAASSLDTDNADAWYALGQSDLQIGKDAIFQLLATAPDGGRVWQLAGEQFQLNGEHERAINAFQKAIERRPDIPELPQILSRLDATVPSAMAPKPESTAREDEFYHRAHDAEQQARAAFEHVAQVAPNSYRAHQILADSLLVQQHPDQAIAEYREVLKLKPDLPGIHEAIGNSLVHQDKLPEALQEFEQELALQPDSATANMNAGRVLLLMGQDDRAQKMLSRALQLDRPPIETYLELGRLDLRRNDFHSAIGLLTHYVSIIKGNSDAYYLLSRAYRAAGDKEQMNRTLELYKQTSRDAQQRSLAQKELEAMSSKHSVREEGADSHKGAP